jgi:hypothetical protein
MKKAETTSGALASNAGDQFHFVYVARKMLNMLNPRNRLNLITVEGVSRKDATASESVSDFLAVDVAEYYGGRSLAEAERVVVSQLKYSHANPDKPWTLSRLTDSGKVLRKLAETFRYFCRTNPESIGKLTLVLHTNQPLHHDLRNKFEGLRRNLKDQLESDGALQLSTIPEESRCTAQILCEATGLNLEELRLFFSLWNFDGFGQLKLDEAKRQMQQESRKFIQSSTCAVFNALMQAAQEAATAGCTHEIDPDFVYRRLNLTSQSFYPAPYQFVPDFPIIKSVSFEETVAQITNCNKAGFTLVHGPNGCGKSTLLWMLANASEYSSYVVPYDCWDQGRGTDSTQKRFLNEKFLTQVINEIELKFETEIFACIEDSETQKNNVFTAAVQKASQMAASKGRMLLIVIDAVDSTLSGAGRIASAPDSLAFFLKYWRPPENCHVIVSSQTQNINNLPFLDRIGLRLEISSVTKQEGREFVQQHFDLPEEAVEYIIENAHGDPRIYQAIRRALSSSDSDNWKIAINRAVKSPVAHHEKEHKLLSAITKKLARESHDFVVESIRFLENYLGTIDRPRPFGGRGQELNALDKWLEDTDAKPYRLMTAPAGRGKSAIIAHWYAELIWTRKDLEVVIVPISLRFKTSAKERVISMLVSSLSRVLGETDRSEPPSERLAKDYISKVANSNRSVLLIIDGIDELELWSLGKLMFPVKPANPGFRVLVTARTAPNDPNNSYWLRQLGWCDANAEWDTLNSLGIEKIPDVLHQMGAPLGDLPDEGRIVRSLYNVSQGDPLLLGLYVQALWDTRHRLPGINLDGLQTIKPGLESFFEMWMDGQKQLWKERRKAGEMDRNEETTTYELLRIFACARGPISRADIQKLLPEYVWNGFTIHEALECLQRFIVGNADHGYSFGHPEFGRHIAESGTFMDSDERVVIEEKFLAMGRSVLLAASEPTSEYAIRYSAMHLEYLSMLASDAEERGRFADYAILLTSHHWMECWLATEGGYTGFLHDIETAQRILRRLNSDTVENISAKRLLQEFRCSLVHASIKEFANNVSPFLLNEAIQRGAITPVHARSLAFAMAPRKRLPVLVKVLQQLGEQDASQTRAMILDDYLALDRNEQITFLEHNTWFLPNEVVREAIVLLRDFGDSWYKGSLVEHLVRSAEQSAIPSLMILASQIHFSELKSSILRVIGNKIDRAHFDQFVEMVDGLNNRKHRFHALELSYSKLEYHQQSLAFTSTMRSNLQDSDTVRLTGFLERVVPCLTDGYVSEILGYIKSVNSSVARVKILALLSPFLMHDDATSAADLAHRTLHRTFGDSLVIWSNTLKKLPSRVRELIIATLITFSDDRFETAVLSLAPSLETGEVKQLIQRALKIEAELNRISVAIRLMSLLPAPSRYEEGAKFLTKAWQKYSNWPLTGITIDDAIHTIELSEEQISNLSRWGRTEKTGSLKSPMGRSVFEKKPPKIDIAEELTKMRKSKSLDGNWLFHLRRVSSDADLGGILDEIIEFIVKSPSAKSTGDYTYPSMVCEAIALIAPVLDELGKDRLLSMIQHEPSLFGSEEVYRQMTKLNLSERQINRLCALAMQNRWTLGYGGLSEVFPSLGTVAQRNVLITVANPTFSFENEAVTQEVISSWFDQTKEMKQQQLMFETACLLSCPQSRAYVMTTIASGDSQYATKALDRLVEACQEIISELHRIKIIEYATSMLGMRFVSSALILYESFDGIRARATCLKMIASFARGHFVDEIISLATKLSNPDLIAEILLAIPYADTQNEKDLARYTLDAIEEIRYPHIKLQTAIKYLERGGYDRERAFSIAMYSLKDASTIQWRHEPVMSLCALIDASQVGLVLDYFRTVTSKRLSFSLAMGLLPRVRFSDFESIIRRVREIDDDPLSLTRVIWHTLSSPHSRDDFLNDLIEVVQRIPCKFDRCKLLAEMTNINQSLVLPLFIAWRERFPTDLPELIEFVCPKLDRRDARQMMEILLQVEDLSVRELGFGLIADRLTDESVVDALKRSQIIGDISEREFALQQVIPLIPKSMLANAIGYLGEIRIDDVRAELLNYIIDQITPDEANLVELAYSQLRRVKDEKLRVSLIITKLNIIAPKMRSRILEDTNELMSEDRKSQVLGSLLPFLSAEEINTAFEQLQTLDPARRVETLCMAGPLLPQMGMNFINAIARHLQEESLKQRIFERYLGLMPESELDESFRIVGSLSNMRQLEIIRQWIDSFDTRSQLRLVSLIREVKSDEARADLLAFCLPRLSRAMQNTAFNIISTLTLVQQSVTYCKVLNALADDHLELVLQHTEKLSDPIPIRDLLMQLLPRLQDRLLQRGIKKLYELNHDHQYKVVVSILQQPVPIQLARHFITFLTSKKRVWNKAELVSAALETMPVEFESTIVNQVSVLSTFEQFQVAKLVKRISKPLGNVLLDAVEISDEETKQQVLTAMLARLPLESMPRGLSILRGFRAQIASKILTDLIKELADSQEKLSLIVHELLNLDYPAEKLADVLFFADGFAFGMIMDVAHTLRDGEQLSFVVRILQLYERETQKHNFDFISRSDSVWLFESIKEFSALIRPELAERFEKICQRSQLTINPRESVLSSEGFCTISPRFKEDRRVYALTKIPNEKLLLPLNDTLPPIDQLHEYLKNPERYDQCDKYKMFKLCVDDLSSLPRAEFMRHARSIATLLGDIGGDQSSSLLCETIVDVGRQLP